LRSSRSPGLFATQGTPVVAGRDFTWTDIYEKRPVAIVSERMARDTWKGVSEALESEFESETSDWREIICVVGDVHDEGPN
jgi:putative ABC transport system permease protein